MSSVWIVSAIVWSACGGAQDGPEEPDDQVAAHPANAPTAAGAWPGVQPTTYPTAASTPYVPPYVPPPPPPTEQECRAKAAQPAPYDVNGVTDVRMQFSRFFDARHDTFRCCFDALEAPSRPMTNARVSLVVRIAADGKLTGVEFAQGSDPISPAAGKCMTDIAGMLSYPAPIGGQPIAYTRVFDFKAHR